MFVQKDLHMKKWTLLLWCLTLFQFTSGQSFNVMSFNIRLPYAGDGENYWDLRRPKVVSMIRFHDADIIGLQEAYRRQLDELSDDLKDFNWTGLCRTDGSKNPTPDNEFSAILYRKSRFELLDTGTFWLSETPDVPGSKGWDAVFPRIVTWAKVKDLDSGKIFFHFNTHFDHVGVNARIQSAELILDKIQSISGQTPVFLTGDFNTSEFETPYLTITDTSRKDHLRDALWLSELPHHGPKSSFAGNFEISGLQPNRIDFLFINSGVKVLKHAILTDSWNSALPSDHLPVWAEIEIK